MKKLAFLGMVCVAAAAGATDPETPLLALNDTATLDAVSEQQRFVAKSSPTVSVNVYDPDTGQYRQLTLRVDAQPDGLTDY